MKKAKDFYKERCHKLKQKLNDQDIVLIMSTPQYFRTSDQHYSFRPTSDMLYLTGWEKENSAFLIKDGKAHLFIERPTALRILWDGAMLDVDEAAQISGVDAVHYTDELKDFLTGLKKSNLYYEFGKHLVNDKFVFDFQFKSMTSPRDLIGSLRLIKDQLEIDILRKACHFSALAHKKVWSNLQDCSNEKDFAREFEYALKKEGCNALAYDPIIAGGANATCLHYSQNNQDLKKGDFLLVDAAGEYRYYASDITRTFAIQSKMSEEQKTIYDIVLDCQEKCIQSAQVGQTLKGIHELAKATMQEALSKAKILKDDEHFKKLYPHGTGHWLGLDVHDECPYLDDKGQEIKLQEGMVFTVEPGLYFYGELNDLYPKFKNIGVRIEDDILITASGAEVMTSAVPK